MSSGRPLLVQKQRGSMTGRAAVLALVFGLLVLTLAVPVRSWFAQRAEIAGLEANVAAARFRVAELQILQERWADPAFIVAEARRRLHFVMPGEVGYTTIGADGLPAASAAPVLVAEAGSWYEKLWIAVQQADTAAPISASIS